MAVTFHRAVEYVLTLRRTCRPSASTVSSHRSKRLLVSETVSRLQHQPGRIPGLPAKQPTRRAFPAIRPSAPTTLSSTVTEVRRSNIAERAGCEWSERVKASPSCLRKCQGKEGLEQATSRRLSGITTNDRTGIICPRNDALSAGPMQRHQLLSITTPIGVRACRTMSPTYDDARWA
jgi:hypothetical protein